MNPQKARLATRFHPRSSEELNSTVILLSVYENDVEPNDLSVWARRIELQEFYYMQMWACSKMAQASIALMFAESEET